MTDQLPQGWTTAQISEICDVPKEKGIDSVTPYLEIGNVSIVSKDYTLTEKLSVKGCRIAKRHDVLVSKVRPTRGAITYIREEELHISSAFTVLRNKGTMAEKYLWMFLAWNHDYLNHLGENCTGTMYPTISDEVVIEFEVPLAPLNEQRRIVAKLEKLLQKVDACKERLDKIPTILKRFRQSILVAACSGRLTADWREKHPDVDPASKLIERIIVKRKTRHEAECADAKREGRRKPAGSQRPKSLKHDYFEAPDSWDLALSYDLFSLVTSGSRGWAKYYAENGSIFLRVGNLDHDSIKLDLSSIQRVNPPKGMEGTRTKIHVGDILISITADTGMIALIKEDIGEAYINQHIALARPIDGFPKEYLAWVLASEIGQEQFKELQRGMTKAGLGLDDIRSVWIPFPPLEEQQEIAHRVEALFKIADQIEERYHKARTYVDKLTQSILAKAFRGELAPQYPNDEPASELLKRIKAECAVK